MGESQLNLCVLDEIIVKFLHKQRIKQMLFYINEQIMPKHIYKNNKLFSIFQILFFCWKKYFKTSVSMQYAQNRITSIQKIF